MEITSQGRTFLESGQNAEYRRIDQDEGVLFILRLVSRLSGGRRSAFVPEWRTYLQKNSNYRSDSVVKDSLYRRLTNLLERGLVERKGHVYAITEAGLSYLGEVPTPVDGTTELNRIVEKLRTSSRTKLREHLSELDPYRFEMLVKELLQAMGYDDVEVTSQSNDKGVDVVGSIQMGITKVHEVIQVKRKTSQNVQRRVLDELRGCLHRFEAVQGTIITLSDFSKGAKDAARERGAAPVTLIDGERLIDLLIENDLCVTKERVEYFTIDTSYLERVPEEDEE